MMYSSYKSIKVFQIFFIKSDFNVILNFNEEVPNKTVSTLICCMDYYTIWTGDCIFDVATVARKSRIWNDFTDVEIFSFFLE